MKSFVLSLSLILALTVSSCGKKAKEKDSGPPENTVPSIEEVYFNSLIKLTTASEQRDEAGFIKIISENPGIDLNYTLTSTGETFLTTAIKNNLNKIFIFLVENDRVSLEKSNVQKETPLIVAIKAKNELILRTLLDRRVDLEKRTLEEETALHIAIKNGLDKIAVLLIKHGANVHALDKYHNNAQALAEQYETKEALELINIILNIDVGAPDISSFKTILQKADQQTLRNVLSRYPKVATDKLYQTLNPLAILIDSKDEINALASAELLLRHQTNVNGPENAEISPLIKATKALKKGFAGLFLRHDADPQVKDKEGKTALIYAIELNNEEIVNLLISKGANVEYKFLRDGKWIQVDACDKVIEIEKALLNENDKKINKRIKRSLGCSFLGLFF